jgi:hypothetical protein
MDETHKTRAIYVTVNSIGVRNDGVRLTNF